MRTFILILSGFALWGAMLGLAKTFGTTPTAMRATTLGFVAVWGVIAAVNMYLGVARAGYSVREELPIFLAIWLAPAIPALIVRWRFL
jgi:Na+-translocating ferredoxin:NAD+ oxidoreductase RnfE subunit